ncbi:MAG: phosphoribosylformylglycinamidine cyclo-ligase [Candidatus Micrarchaeota archaeon]
MKYPVDVKKMRGIQANIWNMIKQTYSFRSGYGEPLPIYGHYGGVFQAGSEKLVMHNDNVGTKIILAQQLNKYDTVGIDVVAMSVNDILCLGAESLVGVDSIFLREQDERIVNDLVKGLVEGCKQSSCALIGGETAVVPELIKEDKKTFDLSFAVVGRVVTKEIITGDAIKHGDVLIGLESSGLHSNGYTLARKLLDIKKFGKEMLEPTRIYVKPVLDVVKQHEIHGIAHITGGAFSKITRINKNVGFVFDNLPKPKGLFKELITKMETPLDAYTTFNMGIGMVLAVPKSEEQNVLVNLKKNNCPAQVVGSVVGNKKGVFLEYEGKEWDLTI